MRWSALPWWPSVWPQALELMLPWQFLHFTSTRAVYNCTRQSNVTPQKIVIQREQKLSQKFGKQGGTFHIIWKVLWIRHYCVAVKMTWKHQFTMEERQTTKALKWRCFLQRNCKARSPVCFTIKGHTETGESCDRKRSKTTISVVSESQQIVWCIAHRMTVSFLPERFRVSLLTKKSHCYHVKRRQWDMPWPWNTTDQLLKTGWCCGLIKHRWTSLIHWCVTSTVKHAAGM